ncbi:hypothetical protein CXF85_11595 [Colwellia sp. 75C3]|uniref:sensor histidine kinase n=1 Tax=Colwellia sp. 75C3 TaxID=888425 RepID=UPI000C34D89B|nr:HAMP domain-containing sensor histidine kinase [Colwellia sp. 75C3]PKG83170.1 hypothetical protein CXF85_11595 [Colwellia sp. 75C3]
MVHLSLSQRVKVTFITSFILLSLISLVLLFATTKGIEDYIFERELILNIEQYQQAERRGEKTLLPTVITVYSDVSELPDNLGIYIDETAIGVYELDHPEDLDYHYAITENAAKNQQIFLFDVNRIELSEDLEREMFRYLLIGFIVLFIVFFLIFQLVVKRALAPMFQLIEQVKQQTYQPKTKQNHDFKYQHPEDNELGLLYKTFGDYSKRIEKFIQREQEFSGFASHELRTPVMIIKGATELLQLQQDECKHLAKPLARIERATHSMEGMIEMLLSLSREQYRTQSQLQPIDATFSQVLHSFKEQALLKSKVVQVVGELSSTIQIEKIPAEIIFSNIIKNAIQHATASGIEIKLTDKTCVISNSVMKAQPGPTSLPEQGYGLGTLIIERICLQHHWQYKTWIDNDHYFVEISFDEPQVFNCV